MLNYGKKSGNIYQSGQKTDISKPNMMSGSEAAAADKAISHSSVLIINSKHQTHHDLTVITLSDNQRRRPQTQNLPKSSASWGGSGRAVVNFPVPEEL